MARPKTTYDSEEVESIINLKLNELAQVKSKLSPNSVWTLNKKLVESGALKDNGEPFKLYGYQFWCVDGYGKQRITEIKNEDEVVLAGESFAIGTQDILALVDKYHKKPAELSKRLVKLFEKDRKKINMLESENLDLRKSLDCSKVELSKFKEGFVSIFMECDSKRNSLKDVLTLKNIEDSLIYDELKVMFDDDLDSLKKNDLPCVENIIEFRTDSSKEIKKKNLEAELFGGL